MIVGYSVDTDILLTTKLLRRKEAETFERVSSSVKTGLTMQLAAIVAMSVLYAVSPAEILKQIAGILIIGLMLDIVFTWIQNVGIMLWYLEYKERKAQ
jgi:preprotein translocase subunit SecF